IRDRNVTGVQTCALPIFLSLTNTADGRRYVEAAFGQEAVFVPYRRPGFALSREVAEAARRHPQARAVVLEKHGLITWGATARERSEERRVGKEGRAWWVR